MERQLVITSAACPARLVPTGDKITIPQGVFLTLTQALGGTYTVIHQGNMARISGEFGELIGQENHLLKFPKYTNNHRASIENINYALETVYDPEIPVNVKDLGLIYGVEIKDNNVYIIMTLTSPGCGMGPVLIEEIKDRLAKAPHVKNVYVEITFEPPWSRELMTEEAQLELGVF